MSLGDHLYYLEGIRYDHLFVLYFSIKAFIGSLIAFIAFILLHRIPLKITKIIAKLVLAIAILLLSAIPSVISGFYFISMFSATILTYLLYFPIISWYISTFAPKKKLKVDDDTLKKAPRVSYQTIIKNNSTKILPILILSLVFPIILPRLLQDMCVEYYNNTSGSFMFEEDSFVSTRFTRSLYLDEVCPPGPPCHVYATLPQDASTSVFINVHTNIKVREISLLYDTNANYQNSQALKQVQNVSWSQSFEEFEPIGRRTVFTFLLSDLEPETEYHYQIVYNGKVQFSGNYKTMPGKESNSPFRVVMGGDVSSAPLARQMTSMLSKYNPDAFIIGGDSAYENALHSCWICWDSFFSMFEEHNRKVNRTIPIVIALGNHDVGFNANANVKVNMERYPLFFYYLPQHLPVDRKGNLIKKVPELMQRKSYFYNLIGKTAFFSLDSKFIANYSGTQLEWIDEQSEKLRDYAKFALYHVPMYPVVLRFNDNPQWVMDLAQKTWGIAFEKHRFIGAFENHNHGYKMTKPLKGGKVNPEGVIYFGDGGWGVPTRQLKNTNKRELFEEMGSDNHVWIIDYKDNKLELYPIDVEGKRITQGFVRKL